MTTLLRGGYQSVGASRCFVVEAQFGSAWTRSASDYWTVELRVVGADESYGRVVATLDLSTRSVAAGERFVVYDDPVGFAMTDGERLRARIVSTGSPAAISDAVLFVKVQRNARSA